MSETTGPSGRVIRAPYPSSTAEAAEPCTREYEHGGHRYWRPGVADRSFQCPGRTGAAADRELATQLQMLLRQDYATGVVEIVRAAGWVPAGPTTPVLGEEAAETARGQIAAIVAMSDDGTDMLDEIMSGPVAALVRAAERRGAEAARTDERERVAKRIEADMDDWLGDDDGYNLYRANAMVRCMKTARQEPDR